MENKELQKVQTVARNYDMGVSTVWALVRQGRFPKPIKISSNMTRWRKLDVDAWAENPAEWEAKQNA